VLVSPFQVVSAKEANMSAELITDEVVDLAREGLYRFLAAALRDPATPGGEVLFDPEALEVAAAAADLLRDDAGAVPLGFGEAPADRLTLEPLLRWLADHGDHLGEEYQRVFGLLAPRECPPYETEYHPTDEAFYRAQQLADVAGFYQAFGLTPAREAPERPDYLPLELEFMALVLMKKRLARQDHGALGGEEVCAEVERQFFRDHLAWWLPSFTVGLQRRAGGGFYAAVAELLAALLPLERARFGVPAPRASLHLPVVTVEEEMAGCAGRC
jgi:TorA maturation chaperone TorD